jgi:tetratricopeptide (TPR) repeat protein
MALRPAWISLLCLGCQGVAPLEVPHQAPAPTTAPSQGPTPQALPLSTSPSPPESAEHLWDRGQDAMRHGHPDLAIRFYQRSLELDPKLARNYVSLAAAYLELGDEATACAHLSRYVAVNPDQLLMRLHLADLLLQLERANEASAEYERCIGHAQEKDDPGGRNLIHCHTQLMSIAESAEDPYGEHLHRGIGLYYLAVARAALPAGDDELPPQALLCKAAGELTLARMARPDEARPAWYLHEVWSRLAQRQPALRALHDAAATAPFSYLTGAEQRGLQLACQCERIQKPVK